MAYTFNPFTGNFDEVGAGGAVTPGGSDTEVQFNDGGSLGGDDGLTFNKTTNALTVGASTVDGGSATVYGDINLDDGGSFSTTVQSVTPTANRTISFPDATGTVALVNGANGTIQYNDAGTLKGNSDFTVDPDWNDAAVTFTGLKLNVTDGAGGSPVGAAGSNLLDLQSGGTSRLKFNSNGSLAFGSSSTLYSVLDGNAGNLALYCGFNGTSFVFQTGNYGVFSFASNIALGWNSTTAFNSTRDLALARDSAGVVKITDGSTGTGYLKLIPTTVSGLTAAATVGAGTKAFVTDSTSTLSAHHGQIVVGGGTNFVPVFSDGTNWIVG